MVTMEDLLEAANKVDARTERRNVMYMSLAAGCLYVMYRALTADQKCQNDCCK